MSLEGSYTPVADLNCGLDADVLSALRDDVRSGYGTSRLNTALNISGVTLHDAMPDGLAHVDRTGEMHVGPGIMSKLIDEAVAMPRVAHIHKGQNGTQS